MNLDLTDQERQLIECLRQQSHRLADRVGRIQSNDFAILIRSDDGAWEINTRSGKLKGVASAQLLRLRGMALPVYGLTAETRRVYATKKARAVVGRGQLGVGKKLTRATLSVSPRVSAMPNILPSKAAAHYLDAIGAAAIYIALPRIGAASVRGLRGCRAIPVTFSGLFGCAISPAPGRLLTQSWSGIRTTA